MDSTINVTANAQVSREGLVVNAWALPLLAAAFLDGLFLAAIQPP